MNEIDPDHQYFEACLHRDNCEVFAKKFVLKNLQVIKNINLRKTIFVDNSIINHYYNKTNGIPIIPYEGNNRDMELLELSNFLEVIKYEEDFRKIILKTFRIDFLVQNLNYDNLLKLFLSIF